MDTPESVLRRLEFKVVRRLDGLLFGDYPGMFYGPSFDLAEVREYQPGDEVRRIDWNVTARMHRLFVRQYLEERELTAWMLVDLSPSMVFGTRRQLKRESAAEFAGVAANSAALSRFNCRRRSEEHTSELQSRPHLVCRLLLEKKDIS